MDRVSYPLKVLQVYLLQFFDRLVDFIPFSLSPVSSPRFVVSHFFYGIYLTPIASNTFLSPDFHVPHCGC